MKLAAVITTLSLAATCAHAQSKQDFQAALDREMHVIDAATVATCRALHPDLAQDIDKNWRQNLAALSADLTEYRKTDAFAKAKAKYEQEQTLEARKPANQKVFQGTCKAMAGR
ncbi:hypothetical protein [Acidovorax sp. LjRoot117]|uniref:hypothetical protein n=1 Tax=Acidovorax sp. LjRoot117 TaxID=3342255 RepID=UPI003ECF68EA